MSADELFEALKAENGYRLLQCSESFVAAAALSFLFVPRTAVVDGFVFLAGWHGDVEPQFSERRRQVLRRVDELSYVDFLDHLDSFNWVEILLPWRDGELSESQEEYVEHIFQERLSESWRAVLAHRYPGREFAVRILTPSETGGCFGIGFREVFSRDDVLFRLDRKPTATKGPTV